MRKGLMVVQSILLSKGRICVAPDKSLFLKTSCDGDPAFSLSSQLEESLSLLVWRLLVLPFFITNLNFPLCRLKPSCSVFYIPWAWRTRRIARAALVVQSKGLSNPAVCLQQQSQQDARGGGANRMTWLILSSYRSILVLRIFWACCGFSTL